MSFPKQIISNTGNCFERAVLCRSGGSSCPFKETRSRSHVHCGSFFKDLATCTHFVSFRYMLRIVVSYLKDLSSVLNCNEIYDVYFDSIIDVV